MASTNLSTAGAVPVKNSKGEIAMEKVKVQRYVSGRKPNYADESSSDESGDELADNMKRRQDAHEVGQMLPSLSSVKLEPEENKEFTEETIKSDRRLRRLMKRDDDEDGASGRPRRSIQEPEILQLGEERRRPKREENDSENDEPAEEDNVERRHALIRQLKDEEEEELLGKEEDIESEDAEEEESEYEEYTDSEDESGPRLKPVFVRKTERITVKEKEKEEEKELERENKARREAEERRKYTLKIIEDENRREEKENEDKEEDEMLEASIAATNTDDENEETAYEIWKVRELKRVKRDKDERDALLKERLEIDRLRNMTEEERQAELAKNPKIVTNKAVKGKYNFLQKYYHRGAFFLDEEDEVLKRDFAQPTLEDHFDKEILPKVMQVKNFGRSGRTKYTHLVDQDTTVHDSPWNAESAQTKKFELEQAGGSKPIFERPSKKRKT